MFPVAMKALLVASLLICLCPVRDLAGQSQNGVNREAQLRAEFAEIAKRLSASRNAHHGRMQVIELDQALEDPRTPENRLMGIHGQLVFEHLRFGDLAKATQHLEKVLSMVHELGGKPTPILLKLQVLLDLRRAEVSNCIQRHHRECCIFPLAGGGLHAEKEAATAVRNGLLKILELQPDQLDAQWLLNIAGMAIGTYPEGIPKKYRLPPRSLESEVKIGRFDDAAPALGLDAFNLCGGALAEDFRQ